MSASLLTVATLLGLAIAAPSAAIVNRDSPELVPGPGLPSLASVNLTTEELHAWPKLETRELSIRAAAGCGPADVNYAHVVDMIPCFNFLNALGDVRCTAPAGSRIQQFASFGSAKVSGVSVNGLETSSSCRDVASAVLRTIDSCTTPDQKVAGFGPANGNDNLNVLSRNVFT